MNFDFHSPHHDSGINEYPYLMKFDKGDNEIYNTVSQALKKATSEDSCSMTYTGEQDIEYGNEWNNPKTPNIKNYYLKRVLSGASITMETPYFGLCDNMFTQEKAINMGKHLYDAVYEILRRYEA